MRVSTNGAFQSGVRLMQQLQIALDQTQQQISTGQRILRPSDDPIAASRGLEIGESLSRIEQFDRNSVIARNRLQFEESALADFNNGLQRVRELAIQANNTSQSDESRSLIASEMRLQLDQLVQLANRKDGSGRYLFAGNMDDTLPVSRSGNQYTYNGDQGRRLIQIGESRQIADGDPGADLFFRIRNGNGAFLTTAAPANAGAAVAGASSVVDPAQYDRDTYTIRFIDASNYEVLDSAATQVAAGSYSPGDDIGFAGIRITMSGAPAAGDSFTVSPSQNQDVFSMVSDLAAAVELSVTDDTSQAAVNNGINVGIANIDQAIGTTLDIRTQVGIRLSAIENQSDSNAAVEVTLQQALSEINDLDYTEALSRLSRQVSVLEAAQQSFIRTQGLSIFNFL